MNSETCTVHTDCVRQIGANWPCRRAPADIQPFNPKIFNFPLSHNAQ